ncbi:MAG: ankyrin repeat domain-containing protein [Oligoflexia bacterium]|nr:ankyrin repeat domain-containing protein [Oligoflexia bacterium]
MKKKSSIIIVFMGIFCSAFAEDCTHEKYPGFDVILKNSVPLNGQESLGINNLAFQTNCRSKFPRPPYTCKKEEDGSIVLSPKPELNQMTTQGKFGACYAAASLFALEYAINKKNNSLIDLAHANRTKYSLSSAICAGNFEKKAYQEGGRMENFLLNIAQEHQLVLCSNELISHKDIVTEILKKRESACSSQQQEELFSQLWEKVVNIQKKCEYTDIPSFTINEIIPEKDQTIFQSIYQQLKSTAELVTISIPDHITNIYGTNSYSCKDALNREVKITTYELIDPNGIKMEVLADDIDKGIRVETIWPIYLQIRDDKRPYRQVDVWKGPTAFIKAMASGDVKKVEEYLNDGIDTNQYAKLGMTPLTAAAHYGNKKIVELLLEKGARIDLVDKEGWTPLDNAIEQGHLEIVKYLVEKGAKTDQANKDGFTPLAQAAYRGHTEIVQYFLEQKANINSGDLIGETPLMLAASRGNKKIVELLLEKGARIELADNNGWTPLNIAANDGQLESVKILVEKGANLEQANKHGATPLVRAAAKGHLEIVKYLVEKGANIEKKNLLGFTPLSFAVFEGHMEVVQYLLEQKANAKAIAADGRSILDLAKNPRNTSTHSKIILKMIQNTVNGITQIRYRKLSTVMDKNIDKK